MQRATSTLRIIGGKWRSRRINFIPLKGVRPTTDALRETLFNWLAPLITDATCLDLFAGSGALGFEALSRGAKHLVAIDSSGQIIANLKKNAALLSTQDVEFYCAKIPGDLNKLPQQPFDIIFLDPPFGLNLIQPTCEKLATLGLLAPNTTIYIEGEKNLSINELIPKTWKVIKQKSIGQVSGFLITTNGFFG